MTQQFDMFEPPAKMWTVRDECKYRHGGGPCITTYSAGMVITQTAECLDWCPILGKATDLLIERERRAA